MFGRLFFDHQSAVGPAKNGLDLVQTFPTLKRFRNSAASSEATGTKVDQAAELWDRVLTEEVVGGEREATKQLRQATGVFGMVLIDANGRWS